MRTTAVEWLYCSSGPGFLSEDTAALSVKKTDIQTQSTIGGAKVNDIVEKCKSEKQNISREMIQGQEGVQI